MSTETTALPVQARAAVALGSSVAEAEPLIVHYIGRVLAQRVSA